MKTAIITIYALALLNSSHAQEVISSQGGSYNGLNFTIGEAVIETFSTGINTDLTQGFHQTNWSFVELEDHVSTFVMSAYPNPLTEELIIEVSEYLGVYCQFTDAVGKVIFEKQLDALKTAVTTGELTPGYYSLILKGGKILKTIKLIKL